MPSSPTHDYDANHCEFYVNSFGMGDWAHNGTSLAWIDAYLSVDALNLETRQGGRVLEVGLYTAGNIFVGDSVDNEAGYYHVGMTFTHIVPGAKGTARPLGDFAFFVDVQRAGGDIDRLWLKGSAGNFTLPQVYDPYPRVQQSLGSGFISWVEGASPIYDQKNACRRSL
ncbi:MAG: hypothetical protein ABIR96_03355 [Bdellovibrionota bacterium]